MARLTQQQKVRRMAAHDGWKIRRVSSQVGPARVCWDHPTWSGGFPSVRTTLPDYSGDLNAINNAHCRQTLEVRMKADGFLIKNYEADPCCLLHTINAPADKRFDALGRAMGLWDEEGHER